ncbi:Acyl-CoA synthetase family member 2, mitochondrial [Holothuria leucospilota]|uniref:Acyl-CoA synthetase family member 2, mitochondrial n=1 Tax=Holothuria leucospilota TaxID=206669 RepID=A0A9Q0YSU8_HOLLE|nr:Acyl-CoA synthetase family member 2, mitochondrial [Holothuria leucospilota]
MRSYGVMKGYWNDPEKTKEVLQDGWMHSGDLGKMDSEGNISIVGRIQDLIIRGGVNIFPAEIEDYLHQHPKVENVQISHFKIPRYVEFVESFPMTASLKVKKFALREMMAKKLGLSQNEE